MSLTNIKIFRCVNPLCNKSVNCMYWPSMINYTYLSKAEQFYYCDYHGKLYHRNNKYWMKLASVGL